MIFVGPQSIYTRDKNMHDFLWGAPGEAPRICGGTCPPPPPPTPAPVATPLVKGQIAKGNELYIIL